MRGARSRLWAMAALLVCAAVALSLALRSASGERAQVAPTGLMSLPAAARGPVSAALGRDEPGYGVTTLRADRPITALRADRPITTLRADRPITTLRADHPITTLRADHPITALRALNPVQHLSISFSSAGVSVASGAAHLHMALSGYGYASAPRPLAAVAPHASANRVSYPHGSLREWYANGPLGLEQGFDLSARPSTGSGPLTLSLALSGNLTPTLDHGSLLLRGRGASLRYGGLIATDAHGRVLHSWLQLAGSRLEIRVDDRGATYPLRIDPFIQWAELTASDGAAEDQLGTSVAISGDTIVAGAPSHTVGSNSQQGAVYVFTKGESGWTNVTQTADLTASDGAAVDWLGDSVAISGDTIVAGAPGHKVGSKAQQGAVYVFTMGPSGWRNATQSAELRASDGAVGDALGYSVAVSGNTIVAGSPVHKVGSKVRQGAVYVFTMHGSGWTNATQSAELTASDGAAFDMLGDSVAISGDTIVAGALAHKVGSNAEQGAVYVFATPAAGHTHANQVAELTASDGAAGDRLGYSVAVSGDTIVAGAPVHRVGSNAEQGAVYVFATPAAGHTHANQVAELTASDGAAGDRLGNSVAISGSTVAAGAYLHRVGSNAEQGAAYVFAMAPSGWTNATQTTELRASDGAAGDWFGYSVAASESAIAAGALAHKVGSNAEQGAAYAFVAALPAAPTVSGLSQTAGRWREGSALARISARNVKRKGKGLPVGTTFSFGLDEPASVAFQFTQPASGRQVGKRCVAQTKRNERKRRCTRTILAGTLTFYAHAGTNRVSFEGRISTRKRLKPGRYTLAVTATAPGGRSTPETLRFAIAG